MSWHQEKKSIKFSREPQQKRRFQICMNLNLAGVSFALIFMKRGKQNRMKDKHDQMLHILK